jgi:hypothetical protein
MRAKRNAYRLLLGNAEGKRPIGRPRYGCLDDIKWGGIYWIVLTQDTDQWRALVNTIMDFQVPRKGGKFMSSCTTGDLSRRAQVHGVS